MQSHKGSNEPRRENTEHSTWKTNFPLVLERGNKKKKREKDLATLLKGGWRSTNAKISICRSTRLRP